MITVLRLKIIFSVVLPLSLIFSSVYAQQAPSFLDRLRELQDRARKGAERSPFDVPDSSAPSLDSTGLHNILPEYDPQVSLSKQFPHIAVTVLKSPHMWADQWRQSNFGVGRTSVGPFRGCFELMAKVWYSESSSKDIGPFSWCSPRDATIEPNPAAYIRYADMPVIEYTSSYDTGITRTDGPRPPKSLCPEDRGTRELYVANEAPVAGRLAEVELSTDVVSKFGFMFANLREYMGVNVDRKDHRVWIVAIRG